MFFKAKFLKLLLILAICSALSWSSLAQQELTQPSYRIENFELPYGRLGNHCQAIAQDSFGFMWFGTQGGLHRWDGYKFKTYLNDPYDSSSISSNYIEQIYVAKDNSLWLASFGGGVNHFDQETEKFTSFLNNPQNATQSLVILSMIYLKILTETFG